jgi:carboxyl-terminal processing protease
VHLLRGVPGTRVVLSIARQGWDKPRDVPLIRRQVRVPSVEHDELAPGVGYVRIRSFQERTDQELAAALADLKKRARARGRPSLDGLVLDLRDNPGGLLDEGVKVADRFIEKGVIVSTEGRNPRSAEKELAHPDGTEDPYPIAALVNQGTASASEIVAGAQQDHGRAVVVGTRSYGKGSVQTLFGLDDGSGLKLTIARYFTPSGRSIQDKGVQPDVAVEDGLPDGAVDLVSALTARGSARLAADRQLKAAFDAVQAKPSGRSLARVPAASGTR